MEIKCPSCSSVSNEMMECDNCQDIGCNRCMKRSQGKWVHHQCGNGKEQQDYSNVFSRMFS